LLTTRRGAEAWRRLEILTEDLLATPEGARADFANAAWNAVTHAESALFLAYLGTVKKSDSLLNQAAHHLDVSLQLLPTTDLFPTLHGGLLGIAWIAHHLENRLFEDNAGLTEQLDASLLNYMASRAPLPFDAVMGVTGIGIYALTVYKKYVDTTPARAHIASLILEKTIETLWNLAETSSDGATWTVSPEFLIEPTRTQYPNGRYDFGVAHGIAGIVAFLAQFCLLSTDNRRARNLLEGATRWLVGHKLAPGHRSRYPSVAVPGRAETSALAWCYGDLGISAALLQGARALGSKALQEEAVATIRRSARRGEKDANTNDTALCHGAVGIAHVFNRMYHWTGDAACRDAAVQWYERTLLAESAERHTDRSLRFLDGIAGIGLALIAAVSDAAPEWDHLLLLGT